MRHKQITASQRQRAEETVDIMETWADGANRQDKAEDDWVSLRAEVENPNLREFEKLLEKEVTLKLSHCSHNLTHSHVNLSFTPDSGTRRHCQRSM